MARHRWTNKEIEEYRKTHAHPGYFNREDSRIFVPKYMGIGITLNWANPMAWLMIAGIIILVVCIRTFIR